MSAPGTIHPHGDSVYTPAPTGTYRDRIRWALRTGPHLDSKERLILVGLADLSTPSGHCFPPVQHLCLETGLSTSSVERSLRGLKVKGLVSIGKLNMPGRHNGYVLAGAADGWEARRHVGESVNAEGLNPSTLTDSSKGLKRGEDDKRDRSSSSSPNPGEGDPRESVKSTADATRQSDDVRAYVELHWASIRELRTWKYKGGAINVYRQQPDQFREIQAEVEAYEAPDEPAEEDLERDHVGPYERPKAARALWAEALEEMRRTLPASTFKTYLEGTEGVSLGDGKLVVRARNPFLAECVNDKLSLAAKRAVWDVGEMDCTVRVVGHRSQEDNDDAR